jgi:uncharacterized protein (TIGR01777 family)
MAQRVVVAGASGLIGGALCRALRQRGDTVAQLVRREPANATQVRWDPAASSLPADVLDGAAAVVNLAGAGIGDQRWTAARKRVIEQSRIDATATLAAGVATVGSGSSGHSIRFVNASAVGYYGDRGDEVLTESSSQGTDFLAGVVGRWETATRPAIDAGAPVALLRTGLVMAARGGAFEPLLRLARLGLGGPLGSGRQWWPWITLEDHVRAILHLIDHPDVLGPVNLAAPGVARQKEIAREVGHQLRRPAVLPAPTLALRLVIGEFAGSVVASQRMTPQVLLDHGFDFRHPDLPSAVRWMLAR